ncbi:MAG: fibronectin type III-like domain-contianing protein, partial [Flavobacteriales bacterium]
VPLADAVVMAYLPGDQGGEALVNILSGKVNPSGRLPFTYPRHNQDLLTYDHKYTEQFDTQFGKNGYNPQWSFGHGLSYATVSYSDMKVSAERVVSFKVKNTGTKPTEEVAILYISDLVATVTPSVKRVADFKRIPLSPGEEKEVVFQLTKEQLSFCMPDGNWVVEPGEFVVSAGNISAKFEINK